ncbi:MAG TPA: hypothetical protein H9842_00245 [Candidatus Agathobaculum merdipullorum]|nr:hypothetical protein [Candidatus Agathobaculum merdipullorum]
MKKFIKNGWFFLILLIAVEVLLGIFLYRKSFRITYAPYLENSWDGISASADWASVIVAVISVFSSFLAIWYAIQVPQKIAEQQNKITLFEKRYQVFQTYELCKIFSELLKSLKGKNGLNSNDIQVIFLAVFCGTPMGDKINDFPFLRVQYISIIDQLKQSQFLFEDEIALYLQKIAGCLQKLIETICRPELEKRLESATQAFITAIQNKEADAAVEKMRTQLILQ